MEGDQRIDYFRSEIKGEISTTRKEVAGELAAMAQRISHLQERIDKLVRELKNLEMSVS
jgi:hypothetical protein